MGKNQHIKSIYGHKTGYNWYIHEPEVTLNFKGCIRSVKVKCA